VLTPAPAITTYTTGSRWRIEPNFTNTGAVTIDVSSLGTKAITRDGANALVGGELQSGNIYDIVYDGTQFQIVGNSYVKIPGVETIWVPAGAMQATVTNGCSALQIAELTAARPNLKVRDFDQTTSENAQFDVAFPKSWDEGTVTFQPFWTTASTNTGTVIFDLAGVAVSNDDAIDAVFGTAQSSTDSGIGTANDLHVGPESSAITIAGTPAADDIVFFNLSRDIADTHTSDARLIGVKLFFTTNSANDG
jgi:hypothetical protein